MKNLIALVALFGMTTGVAGAAGNPFLDWDRIESEVSPTGYVAGSGAPAKVTDHDFADWYRVESELHPTGRDLDGLAVGSDSPDVHPGVGERNMSALRIGSIEYNS